MIGAGKLDTRIDLHKPTVIDNGIEDVVAYVKEKTVWANIVWISDRERFAAGAVGIDTQLRITIRKTEIDHDYRIEYEGHTYAITGIKPAMKNKTMLEITAGKISEGL